MLISRVFAPANFRLLTFGVHSIQRFCKKKRICNYLQIIDYYFIINYPHDFVDFNDREIYREMCCQSHHTLNNFFSYVLPSFGFTRRYIRRSFRLDESMILIIE